MMPEAETNTDTEATFLEALYGDPFREETSRTGRYLVIVSALCIATVAFGVNFKSSSLVPVDFGSHTEVLPMLLALTVLLLLASFLLRSTTDLLRDREVLLLVEKYIATARLKTAEASARATEDDIFSNNEDEGYAEPEPWWDAYYRVQEETLAAQQKAEEKIGYRRIPLSLRRVRKCLEVGVPILFALLAITISRDALWKLVIGVVAALH